MKGEVQMKILTIIMGVAEMWLISAHEQGAGAWTFWLSLGIALSFALCQYIAGRVGERCE